MKIFIRRELNIKIKMLIDTHAHLNFVAYKDDADEAAKRALQEGVWIINVGSQYSTSRRAVEMASKYPEGVFAAVGLHPIHLSSVPYKEKVDKDEEVEFAPGAEEFDEARYSELASKRGVVAMGEIGLDYFHNKENKGKQKEIFIRQIDLACKINLPIIIHCREARLDSGSARQAHSDVLEIIKQKMAQHGEKLRGVVHCFSGKLSQAREYISLGFLIGFNGIITFARDYDKIIQEIELKYLVVETDCPYLTPLPYRGKKNEPAYVKYVAEKIAELKDVRFEEISESTTRNAKKLFNI